MSYDTHRRAFDRAHDDLFPGDRYDVAFYNYNSGSYDPDTGEMTGQSRSSIATTNIELVPPAMDTTVSIDGTNFSWDTSARLPEDDAPVSDFVPLGEDNEKPTELDITDTTNNDIDTYQLHGYSPERGSGFVMLRLVEL